MHEKLKNRFYSVINSRLPVARQNTCPSFWETIENFYKNPVAEIKDEPVQRRYHNLDHIAECCDLLDEYQSETNELTIDEYHAVFLAIIYHDIYYRTDRSIHNEQESALFAMREMFQFGLDYEFATQVGLLVLDTNHVLPARDHPLAKLVRDIDIHNLGGPWEICKGNSIKIREEHKQYSEEEFLKGRYSFLLKTNEQSEIFKLPWFKRRYERMARKNIDRSIQDLVASANQQGIEL